MWGVEHFLTAGSAEQNKGCKESNQSADDQWAMGNGFGNKNKNTCLAAGRHPSFAASSETLLPGLKFRQGRKDIPYNIIDHVFGPWYPNAILQGK